MSIDLLSLCKKRDMTVYEMLGYVSRFIEDNKLSDALLDSLERSDRALALVFGPEIDKRKKFVLISK